MSNPTPPPSASAAGTLRIIVFYRDGVDSDSARAANVAAGVTLVRPLAIDGAALVSAAAGRDMDAVLQLLKRQPDVIDAEPDRRMTIAGT